MHRACRQLSAQDMQPDLEAAEASALLSPSAEACPGLASGPQTQRETLMSSSSFEKSIPVGGILSAGLLGPGDKWDLLVRVSTFSDWDRDRKRRRPELVPG